MTNHVLGNPLMFATQYELDQEYNGSWLLGRFCYWIGGTQVGDLALGTSLRDVLMTLRSIVRDNGNRQDLNLFKLPAEELYRRLDTLYGRNPEYEDVAQEECWARFQIDLPLDIFDHWKIYMVECESEARIVYSNPGGIIVEEILELGIVDKVISDTFNELTAMYEAKID